MSARSASPAAEQVLGGGDTPAKAVVGFIRGRQPDGLLGKGRGDLGRTTAGSRRRTIIKGSRDRPVGTDRGPGQVPRALLRFGREPGQTLVHLAAAAGRGAVVGRSGQQRVGEADAIVRRLQDARGHSPLQSRGDTLAAERGFEDADRRMSERRGMQRHVLGRFIERCDAGHDEPFEAARNGEGLRCRPTPTALQIPTELERVEGRAAGDGMEAGEDRS